MSKSKKDAKTAKGPAKATVQAAEPAAKAIAKLGAQNDSVDPVLASLFASSSGPVKVPARTTLTAKPTSAPAHPTPNDDTSSPGHDSSKDGEDDNVDVSAASDTSSAEGQSPATRILPQVAAEKPRKRKRATDEDDLENAYFKRLQREEDKENEQKRKQSKRGGDVETSHTSSDEEEDEEEDSSATSEDDDAASEPSEVEVPPRHEIFDKKLKDEDKLIRTCFLGNVSTEAIKSKSGKRTLSRHLRSVLKTPAEGPRPGKLESVRFRSTAYTAKSGPKKATFAKKELMDATTTSTNAYAVFTTEAAAEHVAKTLNGSMVLDRHLRVDYLAKPLPIDHKRCVFIGNLSFVNEETQPEGQDGEDKPRRSTAKQPADAEEGLWRTFSKCGAVESVRVVRDQETRVSKGFAYVQFKDENGVEAALLMNEKKFPPMLPRKLRVMRAKKTKIKPTTNAPATYARKAGPNGKMPSKSSVARGRKGKPVVFEGHRASEGGGGKTGRTQGFKDGKDRKNKKRPTSKSAQRGANYKRAKARKRKLGEGK